MKIIYCLTTLFAMGIVGCAHESVKTEAAPQKTDVLKTSPQWTSEDCHSASGYYYFIGFGEGENSSMAIRNALLSSRQHAVACLFGGKISATVNIKETAEKADYKSNAEFNLDYSNINWSGYEIVPGKIFYATVARDKVYAQYRWNLAAIEKERSRIEKLSETVDSTNALKQEVAVKSAMIEEQKEKIRELDKQEHELLSLKSESEQAVLRLTKMRAAREQKSKDISSVIAQLYCGLTVAEFIEIFRRPDRAEVFGTSGYSYIGGVRLYWDQFVIEVPYRHIKEKLNDWPKVGERDADAIRVSESYRFTEVLMDYGKTRRRVEICKDVRGYGY